MRHPKLFAVLLSALIIFTSVDAYAQSVCPRSNPMTEVKEVKMKTKYYRGKSAWFLTRWAKGHATDGVILGLHYGPEGVGPFSADYQTRFEFKPVRNSEGVCVVISEIKMEFRTHPIVHIASEYPEKSCEFKEILKHEKKHVKVTREWQKEFTPKLRRELQSIAKKIPASSPVSINNVEAAQQALVNIVKSHLDEYMEKKAIPVFVFRQNKVDDPLEYRLVPTRCENWVDYHYNY